MKLSLLIHSRTQTRSYSYNISSPGRLKKNIPRPSLRTLNRRQLPRSWVTSEKVSSSRVSIVVISRICDDIHFSSHTVRRQNSPLQQLTNNKISRQGFERETGNKFLAILQSAGSGGGRRGGGKKVSGRRCPLRVARERGGNFNFRRSGKSREKFPGRLADSNLSTLSGSRWLGRDGKRETEKGRRKKPLNSARREDSRA